MRKSFILYTDIGKQIRLLTDAEAGSVIKAVFNYIAAGEEPEKMRPKAYLVFSFIQERLDRDEEKYEQTRAARSRAGKKGAAVSHGQMLANASDCQANLADSVSVSDSVSDSVSVSDSESDSGSESVSESVSDSVGEPVPVRAPVPEPGGKTPLPTPPSVDPKLANREPTLLFGRYRNIALTKEDYLQLKQEFPGDLERRIQEISEYIAATGKTYRSHAAAIRRWAKKEQEDRHGIHTENNHFSDLGRTLGTIV